LDGDTSLAEKKSREIIAVWDTLGWVLFKEGKLEQARAFLKPAWLNRPSPEVGLHFGDVLSGEGDKTAALSAYQAAIATMPPYASLDPRTFTASQLKKIMDRVEALHRAGTESSISTPEAELASLATISLSNAGRYSGQAEYRLQLKGGKLIGFASINQKAVAEDSSILKQASFSAFFPANSDATLVRDARLDCHPNACELVLEP
jgi:hypothetical protein